MCKYFYLKVCFFPIVLLLPGMYSEERGGRIRGKRSSAKGQFLTISLGDRMIVFGADMAPHMVRACHGWVIMVYPAGAAR